MCSSVIDFCSISAKSCIADNIKMVDSINLFIVIKIKIIDAKLLESIGKCKFPDVTLAKLKR